MRLKWVSTIFVFGTTMWVASEASASPIWQAVQTLSTQSVIQVSQNTTSSLTNGHGSICSANTYSFRSITVSPDRRRLIAVFSEDVPNGDYQIQIKQWNVVTGEETPLSFEVPSSFSNSSQGFTKYYLLDRAVFGRDGKTLVGVYSDIVYGDTVIKSWELETGKEIRTRQVHFDPRNTNRIKISQDDNTLIQYADNQSNTNITTITLWNIQSGNPIRTVQLPYSVVSVAVSLNNQIVASQGTDGIIRVQNLLDERIIQTLNGASGNWVNLALSSDGGTLFVSNRNGSISLLNTATGYLIRTLEVHTNATRAPFLTLSADNRTLLIGSGDGGQIQQWDVVTGRHISTLCIR